MSVVATISIHKCFRWHEIVIYHVNIVGVRFYFPTNVKTKPMALIVLKYSTIYCTSQNVLPELFWLGQEANKTLLLHFKSLVSTHIHRINKVIQNYMIVSWMSWLNGYQPLRKNKQYWLHIDVKNN